MLRIAQLTNLIFSISSSGSQTRTWLEFDGLDTFVAVSLCNKFVGNTNNQFRQWTFDVTEIIRKCKGDAVLKLNFGSAPKIVLDIAKTGQGTFKARVIASTFRH